MRDILTKTIIALTIVAVAPVVLSVKAQTNQTACVNISYDLYSGLSDSGSDHSVSNLQTYLKSLGYLGAVPNGHFGPATFSAVKIFQTLNNVTASGRVGPLTRASISQKTCATGTANSSGSVSSSGTPAQVVSQPNQQVTPAPTPVVSSMTITSPATGQILSIGSTTLIQWSTTPANSFNISLEQPGGAGAGFIFMNQIPSNGNQYVWSVGKIFSSQTNSNQIVAPGTYRIRIQSTSFGASTNDQVSGWFTIIAQQFAANSVTPTSAMADNNSSVVLYGTALSSAVSIYFDTNYSGVRANNTYVSPDGTVLVFTIPTNVSTGPHTLYIDNGQNANPITLPFTVTSVK